MAQAGGNTDSIVFGVVAAPQMHIAWKRGLFVLPVRISTDQGPTTSCAGHLRVRPGLPPVMKFYAGLASGACETSFAPYGNTVARDAGPRQVQNLNSPITKLANRPAVVGARAQTGLSLGMPRSLVAAAPNPEDWNLRFALFVDIVDCGGFRHTIVLRIQPAPVRGCPWAS